MLKIFEMQQQLNNIENHQSRIVEFESFEEYLQNVNERSLPKRENVEIGRKHVNFEEQVVTFMFELKINERWIEFTHFAQVID